MDVIVIQKSVFCRVEIRDLKIQLWTPNKEIASPGYFFGEIKNTKKRSPNKQAMTKKRNFDLFIMIIIIINK